MLPGGSFAQKSSILMKKKIKIIKAATGTNRKWGGEEVRGVRGRGRI